MNIGNRIRLLREEKGLTQGELAEKLHVTQSFISVVENKNKNLSMRKFLELAEIFECSVEVITGKEGLK
ncbi:MAG: helix-turn-helix domain-containing protein [Ruminococcus sp.]|nr:helix-turn-helix domain-containing protein [Ruminococcus sp.]